MLVGPLPDDFLRLIKPSSSSTAEAAPYDPATAAHVATPTQVDTTKYLEAVVLRSVGSVAPKGHSISDVPITSELVLDSEMLACITP